MSSHLKVVWHDAGVEPKSAPNPAYPTGIDIDISVAGKASCFTTLPWPAKRIGTYLIECPLCGLTVGITTAGRADDPRSLKLSCNLAAGGTKQ